MKPTPYFASKIENGDLKLFDRDGFVRYIKAQPDGKYSLIVKKWRKPRSNKQNAWYWGVILPLIADETGHTTEELHEIFKKLFLQRQVIMFNGQEYELPGTTTTLNTSEMTEFINRVIVEASNMGIVIPEPIYV